jgi:hypothetical protein
MSAERQWEAVSVDNQQRGNGGRWLLVINGTDSEVKQYRRVQKQVLEFAVSCKI